jgi:hypothetical protein
VTAGKPVRWSPHAVEWLTRRGVDAEEARLAVIAPEFMAPAKHGRTVYMRRYVDSSRGKAMLVRVIVEETATELVVLTVYHTSKVDKYLKGLVR